MDETCSNLCPDLSWDAMVDGNNGRCVCDEPTRGIYLSTSSFPEGELEWPEEIGYMDSFESGGLYDTCDTLCHRQGEWDGYNYRGNRVCVCGSGNELSTVGGDWFNEDGWGLMSHYRDHPGGLKKKKTMDKDAPKKRIWYKINKRHEPVRAHSLIRSLSSDVLSTIPSSKSNTQS